MRILMVYKLFWFVFLNSLAPVFHIGKIPFDIKIEEYRPIIFIVKHEMCNTFLRINKLKKYVKN